MLQEFWKDERGSTAIEYGLIVSLFFLGIVGTIQAIKVNVIGLYDTIGTTLDESVK